MPMTGSKNSIADQAGFTLVEVLVSALVLALGLLGLAGLQSNGLQHNHSAYLRTVATQMAYDLSDRMRANLAGFQNGDYNNPKAVDHNCSWNGSGVAVCTVKQKAEHDMREWRQLLSDNLPNGAGVVCVDGTPDDGGDNNANGTVESTEYGCDNTAGSLYVIKVWWQDERGSNDFKQFILTFNP